ncbi:DUF58 domain-containing protein [Leifsonia sp. Root112D2]|jgi:uncharacterized protein (DUF58 family)|uniref:DUF58 domain-containing protein n=1 Tax=Leifsonia sp. Root112D2 TaxID=1736426 RepID=UPI0006FFBA9A|nr:DUF58 domain-containing protein [Leifsonia sp. Root112D2]KQV07666.1 hypothetical protein ASC63_10635 [Leifsonia sp. Root112D2]
MTDAQTRTPSQTLQALRQLWRAMLSGLRGLLGVFAPAWAAIRRVLGPAASAVSTIGWLVLAAAAVSFLLSIVLGWVEFTFLGATLLAGFLIAVCFVFGRSTYSVLIELNPRRVVAGDRALGRMLVTNSGGRAVLPTRMELPVGAGVAEFMVPRLAPGAESEELFAMPTHRRALILAGPAISVRGDQLGIVRRTVSWTEQVELFVHPQTTRLLATARGLVRDLEGQTSAVITNSDLAFHALRQYEAGDDIRNVHWRTSARTGQLMVRQYTETRRSQLLLVQSAETTHYASDDEFELAISVMASIGSQVIREKTNLNVVWEKATLRNRSVTALLDDSCRIQPVSGEHASLRDFVRAATRKLPVPSLTVVVVGSQASTQEVRSVSTLYGQDTVLIAVRVELGAQPALAKIGGTMLATVGKLSDLPAILDRTGR